MSGNYVLCSKVKSWMEGALKKVLNQISQSSAGCAVLVSLGNRKVWLNVSSRNIFNKPLHKRNGYR